MLGEHFSIEPVRSESEGSRITLAEGFDAAAVRLSMAYDVPADVKALIVSSAAAIASGRITVPEAYDGPEFPTPV